MDVVNWGWNLEKNQLFPIMSEMNTAPDNLLKMVHCNCLAACRTPSISCRGYKLPCHTVCGPCQLETCDNQYNQSIVEEQELSDNASLIT